MSRRPLSSFVVWLRALKVAFWMRAGYAVGLFRLLPVGVLDAVVGLMGINASMDHFVQTRSAPSG